MQEDPSLLSSADAAPDGSLAAANAQDDLEKTVTFGDDDEDESSYGSTTSSADSRGLMRSTSTLARAASFMQMEKARGRVPSLVRQQGALPVEAATFENMPPTPKKTSPRVEEGEDEDASLFLSSSSGGLLVSEAQMKLFGVSNVKELRSEFFKVLDKGAPNRKGLEQTGPAVGRPCIEAIVGLSQKKKKTIDMSRVDELATAAKPSLKKGRKQYDFKPRTMTEKKLETMRQCGYEFVDRIQESREGDFVDRVSRVEKQRRARLERARGQAEYELRVDKKVCPQCGATQTYDEVITKKKRCQHCGVEYRVPRPRGSKGLSAWLDEQTNRDIKRKEAERQAQRKYDRPRRGNPHHAPSSKTQRQQQHDDFLARLTADLEKRAARKKSQPDQQEQKLPPPPPYERQRRRRQHVAENKISAPASPPKKSAPIVSKWEDDLEEYIRRTSTSQQSKADEHEKIGKKKNPARPQSATVGIKKKKKIKKLLADTTCLDKFDQLLYT